MLRAQHAIPPIVAVAYVAVAAAGGGFSAGFRAGAAVVLSWALVVGIGFGVWPRERIPPRALVAGAALLALFGLTALSMAWASDDGAAFEEAVRVGAYLALFAVVVAVAPAGSARLWLGGLAAGVVVVAALALGSRIEPDWFPEQDLPKLIPTVATRLSYPLNYWNALAACMALGIVLLIWHGAHARSRAGRALAVAAVPALALTLFLAASRGGAFALAVGLCALLAATPGRTRIAVVCLLAVAGSTLVIALAEAREAFVDGRTAAPGAAAEGREMLVAVLLVGAALGAIRYGADGVIARLRAGRTLALAALAGIALAAVVAMAALDPLARWDEFKEPPADPGAQRGFVTRHLASAEGSGRYQFWGSALDAFETQPVRGVGAGGYEAWWAQHRSLPYYIRDAHSLFLEVLAELGIAGLLALLGFLVAAAAGAIRAAAGARARPGPGDGERYAGPEPLGAALALLVTGSASAAVDWTWEVPAAFGPVVLAAAILAGPALAPGRGGRSPRFGLGLAALAVAWAIAVGAAAVLVSETKLADSRSAVRAGNLAEAADDAAQARAVAPWAAAPRLQLALIRERQGDIAGARRAAREAEERDSGDWRVWLVQARLAVKAADVPAARRALQRARELNPRSALLGAAPDPP